mmetsp:Transcript_111804/g.193832  ORF Transcript_111804/g.193832 Transcript_111804/m.193832 type:complete len:402 (+) Transcript_111804:50-1255(+)
MAGNWACRRLLSGVLRCTALLLWLARAVSGESTYAGDRDVRFLTCAVPCEFECENPEVPAAALLRTEPAKRMVTDMKRRVKKGSMAVDLLPQGKRDYTLKLRSALEEALNEAPQQKRESNESQAAPQAVPSKDLPFVLRKLGWSCEENCRYDCMVKNRRIRHEKREQQVHYYGKWPFTRVLGVQELFSSLFSAFNGLPYLWFLASCTSGIPKGTRTVWLWIFYALAMTNTWLQSTLFHARENKITELLDYHGATLGLSASLSTALMMHLPEHWSVVGSACLAATPVLLFWFGHVLYLSFVYFDYGYNMKVAVGLGICTSLSWLTWFLRHRGERRFAWKCIVASLGPYLVLPLELLDFPPAFGLMDAHACWHLGTVPMSFVWCSFMQDVIRWEAEAAASKVA